MTDQNQPDTGTEESTSTTHIDTNAPVSIGDTPDEGETQGDDEGAEPDSIEED